MGEKLMRVWRHIFMGPLFELLVVLALALVSFSALAAEPPASKQAPDQMLRTASQEFLAEIQQQKAATNNDPAALRAVLDRRSNQYFDFDRICQLVLGQHWTRATPAQREQFARAFQRMLVRSYATAMLEAQIERIDWMPVNAAPDATDVTVRSSVVRPGAPAVPISYKLHLTQNGWKVYDVSIEGISLITNYRNSFSAVIKKNGLDSVIAQIEAKQAA